MSFIDVKSTYSNSSAQPVITQDRKFRHTFKVVWSRVPIENDIQVKEESGKQYENVGARQIEVEGTPTTSVEGGCVVPGPLDFEDRTQIEVDAVGPNSNELQDCFYSVMKSLQNVRNTCIERYGNAHKQPKVTG